MDRLTMPDKPFKLDHPEDYLWLVIGIIIAGFALYNGGFDLINDKYSAYQASKLTPYYGEDIYFTQFQIDKIDSDYIYNGFELGYCGNTNGNKVVNLRVGNIRYASEAEVVFSCKPYERLYLHLHPSGISALSEGDKETLMWLSRNDDTFISCVYAGNRISCASYDSETERFLNHVVHIGS